MGSIEKKRKLSKILFDFVNIAGKLSENLKILSRKKNNKRKKINRKRESKKLRNL